MVHLTDAIGMMLGFGMFLLALLTFIFKFAKK